MTIAANFCAAIALDGDARDRWARAYGNEPFRTGIGLDLPSYTCRPGANITRGGVKGHSEGLNGYVGGFESQNPLHMAELQAYLGG